MILFIAIAVTITLVVLTLLVRPLLRQNDVDVNNRETHNIHYAKQRLAELQQQRESGKLTTDAYKALRLEIEANLAQDIDLASGSTTDANSSKANSSPLLIAVLCSLVPIAALLLYWKIGTPDALNAAPIQAAQTAQSPQPSSTNADIQEMVTQLQKRLEEQPNDPQGWTILARTLLATGQYRESIEANKKLLELKGENADTYAAMADASAVIAGGAMQGQPQEYVQRALQIDPAHPQSLWLAGLAEAQQGNNENARGYWNTLMPLLADMPQQQQELADIIQQTMGEAKPVSSVNNVPIKPSTNVNELTLAVSLADNIKDQAKPNDTLFVMAKAKQGPPAPLAVKRLMVKDLPTQIILTDADAMMPQFSISKFEDIIVTARISKSGQPIAQTGDLQSAQIETKNNNAQLIELEIKDVVE